MACHAFPTVSSTARGSCPSPPRALTPFLSRSLRLQAATLRCARGLVRGAVEFTLQRSDAPQRLSSKPPLRSFCPSPHTSTLAGGYDTDGDNFLPAEERTFRWTDGSPFDFEHWYADGNVARCPVAPLASAAHGCAAASPIRTRQAQPRAQQRAQSHARARDFSWAPLQGRPGWRSWLAVVVALCCTLPGRRRLPSSLLVDVCRRRMERRPRLRSASGKTPLLPRRPRFHRAIPPSPPPPLAFPQRSLFSHPPLPLFLSLPPSPPPPFPPSPSHSRFASGRWGAAPTCRQRRRRVTRFLVRPSRAICCLPRWGHAS